MILVIILTSYIGTQEIFAESEQELNVLFKQGNKHLQNAEYKQAITTYDQILEINPSHLTTLNMKAIAHSNMEDHTESLIQFYNVLQKNPKDSIALTGMGVGFGNLGEYEEAIKYLNKAGEQNPDSTIIKNYKKGIEKTLSKYPYKVTEKPINTKFQKDEIPNWVKDTTNWWSMKKINEQVYFKSVEYMIQNNIIKIPEMELNESNISQVRQNLSKWSENQLSNEEFFRNTYWLMDNKFIEIKKSQEDIEYEQYLFKKYLRSIVNNISKETRYIEDSNPSEEVIKRFLRDYVKWNFEQQVKLGSEHYPDPTYEIIDEVYFVKYKIYVNDQPTGLPLDHKSTMQNTFDYWEDQELKVNGQNAKIKFEFTKSKAEANVWVTWVVRNMGEGVLGHAHLGKGVVEVALGDFKCGGNFQLYDVESVKTIMTHEIGHSIGLGHSSNPESIMYPTYTPSYAYCLLN